MPRKFRRTYLKNFPRSNGTRVAPAQVRFDAVGAILKSNEFKKVFIEYLESIGVQIQHRKLEQTKAVLDESQTHDTMHDEKLPRMLGEAINLLILKDVDAAAIGYFVRIACEKMSDFEDSNKWLQGDSGLTELEKELQIEVNILIKEKESKQTSEDDVLVAIAPDILDQPIIFTDQWRIYVVGGDVFLVCVNKETGKIGTSSPILKSDLVNQEFTTESGRVYKCTGEMAPNYLLFRASLYIAGVIDFVEYNTGEPGEVH